MIQFFTELTKPLHQNVYDQKDKWRKEAESNKLLLKEANKHIEELILINQQTNDKLLGVQLKESKVNLSKFTGSVVWTFPNRTKKDLRTFLNIQSEKELVLDWITTNLHLEDYLSLDRDKLLYQLRYDFAKYHNHKDPHVPEDKGRDNWKLPSQFIKDGLKGDCEDNMLFIKYMYDVICETKNKEEWKHFLYCAVGASLNKYGLTGADHAYLIYEDTKNKFYQVESAALKNSDYIKFSLQNLFIVEIKENIRYPFPYKMWNQHVVYENPSLQ